METQTCTKCKETKPVTSEYFYPREKKRGGFETQCKMCRQANAKVRRIPQILERKKAREKRKKEEAARETMLCKRCDQTMPFTKEFFNTFRVKVGPEKKSETRLRHVCRKCRSKREIEANIKCKQENPEEWERRQKVRNENWLRWSKTEEGQATIKEKYRRYCEKPENRQKIRDRRIGRWNCPKFRKSYGEWSKNREKTHPHFKITRRLRNRISSVIKQQGGTKSQRTIELIGCSVEDFITHFEDQFTEGMTWENYGRPNGDFLAGWHIDHIRPCASFDLTDPEQQRVCFHYTNLQPLWAKDNLSKGDKYDPIGL